MRWFRQCGFTRIKIQSSILSNWVSGRPALSDARSDRGRPLTPKIANRASVGGTQLEPQECAASQTEAEAPDQEISLFSVWKSR